MKNTFIFYLLPLIAACNVLTSTGPVITTRPVVVDSEVLKECSNLKPFNINDDIGVRYIELVSEYGICSNRQHTSIQVIKKLGNINE